MSTATGPDLPVGVAQLTQVSLNCAACHLGTVRDAPTSPPRLVPGMPSHRRGGRRFFERDTTLPGNGNRGHEGPAFGTGLGDADKAALLEYLKTLTPLTGVAPAANCAPRTDPLE